MYDKLVFVNVFALAHLLKLLQSNPQKGKEAQSSSVKMTDVSLLGQNMHDNKRANNASHIHKLRFSITTKHDF